MSPRFPLALLITLSVLLSPVAPLFAGAPGFLLVTCTKYTYSGSKEVAPSTKEASGHRGTEQVTKFKVLLDEEFMHQFSEQDDVKLYCAVGDRIEWSGPGMSYLQWFAPRNGKLTTWIFGKGAQVVNETMIPAYNAVTTSQVTVPGFEAVDFGTQQSFVNEYSGINLDIHFKHVVAGDPSLEGALLAPVKKRDGSALVPGDAQDGLPFRASFGFQR